ncbi:MAG: hypothetical protein SVY10_17905 [Thermodesulfobacteriota bacterium]|nr:hypothetical protein [Thermodesulfobacteriota bacterium]
MIELSPPLKDTLKKLKKLEGNPLTIFLRGLKELLKECEEEILNLEIKYGCSFEEFREMLEKEDLGEPFSYPLEKDAMKWEDLMEEKRLRLKMIRELEQLK